MNVMPDALTYSVPEAAKALGLGKNTLYELVASGRIPHIRNGRTIRIPKALLGEWLHNEAAKNAGK